MTRLLNYIALFSITFILTKRNSFLIFPLLDSCAKSVWFSSVSVRIKCIIIILIKNTYVFRGRGFLKCLQLYCNGTLSYTYLKLLDKLCFTTSNMVIMKKVLTYYKIIYGTWHNIIYTTEHDSTYLDATTTC